MNRSTRAGLVLIGLLVSSPWAIAGSIQPEAGLWQQKTLLSADGQSWRPASQTQGCLTKAQASAWESQVRQQIADASCSINRLSVINGKITGQIACATMNKPVVTLVGQYSTSAYSVDLVSDAVVDRRAEGGAANAPVTVFAKWIGARLGNC